MNLRLATILLCVSAVAQAPADFRGVRWGMTPEQVRATEPGTPMMGQSGPFSEWLVYSGQFGGRDINIMYVFFHGKLARASYRFTAKHKDDLNDFIADYRAVEPLLRKSLGDPVSEKAVWVDDSLQEERKSYLEQDRATPSDILPSDRNVGLAVSVGNLKLYTNWTDGRSKILHALTGAEGAITHEIDYSPAE
jgi:hypothetical protein